MLAKNDIMYAMKDVLRSFAVQRFRSLGGVELSDLGRVNVFVGRNGSGKTSILEALYLFFSHARLESIIGTAERRGEYDKAESGGWWAPSVRHFFSGHSLPGQNEGVSFSGDGVNVCITTSVKDMPLKDDYRVVKPTLMCHVAHLDQGGGGGGLSFPISKSGAIDTEIASDGGYSRRISGDDVPVVFVNPDGVDPRALLKMRDEVVSRGEESELVDVLKILNPNVKSVGFLSADEKRYEMLVNGTLVGLDGVDGRVPIKTLGDGMRRLLVIAMSMICAKDGALMLDEIDAGLHYSAMPGLWTFIYEAAVRNNVQVFASTHSLDCLRGLGAACEMSADVSDQIRLYAFSTVGKRVVSYSGREVAIAIDREIEVRT